MFLHIFLLQLLIMETLLDMLKMKDELKKGNLSLILNLLIFSFFAVFIVIGSDIFLNKNLENMERILTNPTDILEN